MRIPLGDLEEARRNPRAYLQRRTGEEGGVNYKSKYLTLIRAAYRFHKPDGNLIVARQYLEASYNKQFKDPRELPKYVNQLEQYVEEFVRLQATVIKTKDRIVVPLADEFGSKFIVSGEIPRLDITTEGFNAWLFSKETANWQDELRLPIIQSAYAQKLSAQYDEIKVGVYDFSKAAYISYSFTKAQLEDAQRTLIAILRRFAKAEV